MRYMVLGMYVYGERAGKYDVAGMVDYYVRADVLKIYSPHEAKAG